MYTKTKPTFAVAYTYTNTSGPTRLSRLRSSQLVEH